MSEIPVLKLRYKYHSELQTKWDPVNKFFKILT